MKFTTKVKPVKIRIISGGEEHSNLETLKRNFDFGEVMNLIQDHRMSTWLRRQHQDEMAQKVEGIIANGPFPIKDTMQNLVMLYNLFFQENEASSVSDIIQIWKDNNVFQKNIELLNLQLASYKDTLLVINNILRCIRIKNTEIQQKDRKLFVDSSVRLKDTVCEQVENGHKDLGKLRKLYEDYLVNYYLLRNDSMVQSSFNDVLKYIREMRHIPSFLIMQDIISSSKTDVSFSSFIIKETDAFNKYFRDNKNQISQYNTRLELDNQLKKFDSQCSDVEYLELVYYLTSALDGQISLDFQTLIQKNAKKIREIDKNEQRSHADLFEFLIGICPSINEDKTKELVNTIANEYDFPGDASGQLLAVKKIQTVINKSDYDSEILSLTLHLLCIRHFILKNESGFLYSTNIQSTAIFDMLHIERGSKLELTLKSFDRKANLDGYFEIIKMIQVTSPEVNSLVDDLAIIIDPKVHVGNIKCFNTENMNVSKYTISLIQKPSLQFGFESDGYTLSPKALNEFLKFVIENLYTILGHNE